MEFKEIANSISQAFINLDSFMSGKVKQYFYFGFNDEFEKLFSEYKKPENYTPENTDLMSKYYTLSLQVNNDFWDVKFSKNTEIWDRIKKHPGLDDDRWELEHLWWSKLDDYCETINLNEVDSFIDHRFSYSDILKTASLPIPQIKKPDSIKLFPEYFQPVHREILSELCKKLFNFNKSPKVYAIMFCLLTQKRLLHIPYKRRSDYFKSWYNFIEKPFPTRNNFEAINKHFLDVNAVGFLFDDCDVDYLNLKASFEKELTNNNIRYSKVV